MKPSLGNFHFGFFIVLFLISVSTCVKLANASDPTTNLAPDQGLGGASDCDSTCKTVISQVNTICDQNGQKSIVCLTAKNEQIYYQCLSYDQAGWAAFFDSYMIVLDTIAAAACTDACWAQCTADPAAIAATEPVCNATALADGVGDLTNELLLNRFLGNNWAGSTTAGQVNTALGIAGVAAGLFAF